MIFQTIFLIALLVIMVIFGIYFFWSLSFGAPYVPSMGNSRKEMLRVSAELMEKRGVKLRSVELGAGDANISFALTKMGYQADALEINPFLTLVARFAKLITANKHVHIYNKDMFLHHYQKYDLAVIYLFPHLMDKLESVLFEEMPKGAIIISNTFTFKNHQPVSKSDRVLVYEVK
jgi:hypothetical protein